jgi:transglutaminase-like putative cysteine protease
MALDLSVYTAPSETITSDTTKVRRFAREHAGQLRNPRQQAVALYYAVRDGILYDPYTISVRVEKLLSDYTLDIGRGWCVAKAIVLAAACRSLGIPARLGFADVRNHLSTARMRALMQTDIFYWHGYTDIHVEGKWVKATPAFNIELCDRFRLKPLDFDGRHDAIFHSFDLQGHRHMEYLRYRGEFTDVPLAQMNATFQREYKLDTRWKDADFDREVISETAAKQ